MYPNGFALHALSWAGGKGWEHREVYSAARVRFVGVWERAADGAVLELRPNFLIWLDASKDIDAQLKRPDEVNKPFAVRLILKDAVPTIKQVAAERGAARRPDRRPNPGAEPRSGGGLPRRLTRSGVPCHVTSTGICSDPDLSLLTDAARRPRG